MRRIRRHSTRRPNGPAALLALLALVVRLAVASAVPWSGGQSAAIDTLITSSICHAESDQGDTPAPHHDHDCTDCPLCQALAHGGAVLAPAVMALSGPPFYATRAAALPPARAPPARRVTVASARGPPGLS